MPKSFDGSVSEGDEAYYDQQDPGRAFDSKLLRKRLDVLPANKPIVLSPRDSVTDAVRAMQAEHRGCIVVTEDGTSSTATIGIFTERDVLNRIVDRGKNPATLPLSEVMTRDPESLVVEAPVARLLNMMSVGGFRHVPVVDRERRPVCVVSVKDVVQFLVDSFPREILNLPTEGTPAPKSREGA